MAQDYQQEQASLIAEEKEAKRLEMLQRLRKQSQLENERLEALKKQKTEAAAAESEDTMR